MNPFSAEMMTVYHSYRALSGLDENCADYISYMSSRTAAPGPAYETAEKAYVPSAEKASEAADTTPLRRAVCKGLKELAAKECAKLLEHAEPMSVVTGEIIPALDAVGADYEAGRLYLPQLLMSAEAAKSAFEVIKTHMSGSGKTAGKGVFVIATVHGDIHDIGKNIVKLLLENYGFDVVDLGKDVPPETVAEAVVRLHAPLAGLSALMTTTVPAMEETIKLLREKAPWCRTVVGGAVLTQEYADKIGADKYAKDAMETVRYAESVISSLRPE